MFTSRYNMLHLCVHDVFWMNLTIKSSEAVGSLAKSYTSKCDECNCKTLPESYLYHTRGRRGFLHLGITS
ncbi:Hypothetical predicted protein [Octopus vulgaris]|uniref:Uncharacterized protein n=1 Tax=Octopus vulgaris TaxID=6645 RepID=A0AA36BAQ5_OCTVU|nr:Hypothetical predicted protein [Octopus vulgaris]